MKTTPYMRKGELSEIKMENIFIFRQQAEEKKIKIKCKYVSC